MAARVSGDIPFSVESAKVLAALATRAAARAVETAREIGARVQKAVEKSDRPLVIHYARR